MRELAYTVVFERQPEGGFAVHVPALPGCITEAETLDEARISAADAIRAYCESLPADGEAIPRDFSQPPRHERVTVRLAQSG